MAAVTGRDKRLIQTSPVVGFETRGDDVLAVRTGMGEFPCREVVIAAAAGAPTWATPPG